MSSSHSPSSSFFSGAFPAVADAAAAAAASAFSASASFAILAACFRLAAPTLKLPGGRPRRFAGSCVGGAITGFESGGWVAGSGLPGPFGGGGGTGVWADTEPRSLVIGGDVGVEVGEMVESEDLALPVGGVEGGGGDEADDRFRL